MATQNASFFSRLHTQLRYPEPNSIFAYPKISTLALL